MSASLVGSEMCIRDSPNSSPRGPWSQHAHRAKRLSPRLGVPTYDYCWSVSYTHLTLPTICSV
eukprot:14474688-Alexandrium_andersonii.AAC.1